MRHSIVQEVLAEFFEVDQAVISRVIGMLTPLIARATEDDRSSADEAKDTVREVNRLGGRRVVALQIVVGPPGVVNLCSSRTRGWTRALQFDDGLVTLLPAHAGMAPHSILG